MEVCGFRNWSLQSWEICSIFGVKMSFFSARIDLMWFQRVQTSWFMWSYLQFWWLTNVIPISLGPWKPPPESNEASGNFPWFHSEIRQVQLVQIQAGDIHPQDQHLNGNSMGIPNKWDTHTIPIKGGSKPACWSLERSLKTRLYGGPKRWSLLLFLHDGPTKTIVINGVNEITRYKWPSRVISPYKWTCFTPFITGFLGAHLVSLLLASKVDRQTNVMFGSSKWMW